MKLERRSPSTESVPIGSGGGNGRVYIGNPLRDLSQVIDEFVFFDDEEPIAIRLTCPVAFLSVPPLVGPRVLYPITGLYPFHTADSNAYEL